MATVDEPEMQIAWRDGLSVGHAIIDSEHKNLIAQVNELNSSLLAHGGQKEILPLMQRLLDTAKAHFANEERILRECDYPETERQRRLHAMLTADFMDAMDVFAGTDPGLTWLARGLLISRALMEHLAKEDMKFRDLVGPKST